MTDDPEKRTSAIGYLNYGKSYLDCAIYLAEGLEKRKIDISHMAPVYQLIGQAYELFFKAIIRTDGVSTNELKGLAHNLERLATKSQSVAGFSTLIRDLDVAQKDYWRKIAKAERDDFLASDSIFVRIKTVPSNEEIDRKLPNFLQTLGTLNNLYDAPYLLRYFSRGNKNFPMFESLYVPALMLFDRAETPCYEYSKKHELDNEIFK